MNRVQIAVLGVTVLAFGGAYVLFNSGQAPPPQIIQAAPKIDTDEVLVAARDLPMGTQVAEPDYVWQKWPTQALSELMIKKSEGPQALENVKGAVTRGSFLQGEPMRRDKLIKGPNSGFLSAILPSGMRAVAINIDPGGGATAGGFILPNDRVDVIRVYRDEEQTKARGVEVNGAQTILTNVRVLAIAQSIQEKGADKGTALGANATLELTPEQAELIILAQRMGGAGNLHLTLRSMLDAAGKTDSVSDLGVSKGGGLTIVRAGAPQQASR
ncbi:Flp pilus assembly protein CpaB [Methylocapsa sp. S129]|uniref:Flp pilus assembly protein CpaB n=1 Tax=Methylocapsa sp. S129 TaxID=1641869 RepID=UPI00131D8CD7|nr:Flp pilus assembly protein CpaB [Methylocapsa sp. S129]